MVMKKLGESLRNLTRKIKGYIKIDAEKVREITNTLQRALIEADVNIELVLTLTEKIEKQIWKLEIPPGFPPEKYLLKIIFEELSDFLGRQTYDLKLQTGKKNIILMVGIQGSGKTTTTGKLARFLSKKGIKLGVVCADTYRPGAYDQLKQICEQVNIPFYGEPENKDSVKIAKNGVKFFDNKKIELIIVDTAGRHKDEDDLMDEMKQIKSKINPTEIILVIDGTMGQAIAKQAFAFNKATDIGSIIITKLDGSAKGGGALSAAAATGAPVKFIGTGEKLDEFEKFDPKKFISNKLLGEPDLDAFLEKVKEAEIETELSKKDLKTKLFTGKFNLQDMYEQMKAVKKMGPISKVLGMMGGGAMIPDEMKGMADDQIDKIKYILDSMTKEEKNEPKIINASRIKRVARGSGTSERDIKDFLSQFNMMKKMVKQFGKQRKFRKGGKGPIPGGIPGMPTGGLPKKFKFKGFK
ncbi:MAG: signal recognition particle protein [Candidatus Lokiarchaeota archaeon]|nr:signal recognition particle protein [Candidatus Lokiarchaeota archaeon]